MTDQLIDHLVFDKKKKCILDELQRNEYPIVIYGAGSYARDVLMYLSNQDVLVQYVVADEVENSFLEQFNLERLSYESITFSCVLVMGFAMYYKGKELAECKPNIKKVFYPCLMPYNERNSFRKDVLLDDISEYQKAYALLEDDMSRRCMDSFLNTQINEDASFCFLCYEGEQNYFLNSVFSVRPYENYLDIGAYTGDTVRLFVETVRFPKGHIWAVEADCSLKEKLLSSISEVGMTDNSDIYFTGVWDKDGVVYFNRTKGNNEEGYVSEHLSGEGDSIRVCKLDSLLSERKDKVDFLKINFLNADRILIGGADLIRQDKPKLAITVGFGRKMIAEIPTLIKRICPEYKVFLRFNSPMPAKIVCYAKCE